MVRRDEEFGWRAFVSAARDVRAGEADGQAGGGQGSQPGQGTPAAGGGTEGTPQPQPAPASQGGAGAQGAAPAGQTAGAAGQQGARDFARQHGLDVSGYADDSAFLQALIAQQQQAPQLRQLAQYGQTYLQHAAEFEQWRQQRAEEERRKAEAQKPKWWNPPEYNPAWASLVTQDDSGNYQLRPGAPPDVLPKYLAYQQYKRDFADRLLSDPAATLRPLIEDVAAQIAERQAQGSVQAYRDQAFTQQFVAENSAWLHQRDAQGQVLRNAQGQPLVSPAGATFRQYLLRAEQLGIHSLPEQAEYARALLQRDLLLARGGGAGDPHKDALLQQGNRRPNAGGGLTPQPNGDPAPPAGGSLREQLIQAFRQNGITDADFAGV